MNRPECDHDYQETDKIVHESDSEPVSMNPISGAITSRLTCFEVVTYECMKCGDLVDDSRSCQEHKRD